MAAAARGFGRWRLVLGAVVLFIASLELASLTILKVVGAYPDQSYRAMYESSACMKVSEFNYGRLARSPQELQVLMSKIPHPFFGITVNPERSNIEWRDGLVGANANELRYRVMLGQDPRPRDTFTIGIFGASVAGAFAGYVIDNDAFQRRLQSGIPSLQGKRIEIRDMAIGSSRQPSQYAVATHYMELLDMTINLDGYSEIAVIQHPQYPIEFPMFADVFYSPDGPSKYLEMRAGEEVCRRISDLPQWLPPLAYSSTYYLLWYNISKRLSASLDAPRTAAPGAGQDTFSPDEVRELYARYFQKYTRYQHQVLSANGVRSYFFLQPNQYVAGSKSFSEAERAGALGYDDSEEIRIRYALLQQKVRELRSTGVPAFDLTMAFVDVPDTVYIDSCCHVNNVGNKILAERIAEIIVSEEKDRGAPQ